ncbi:uncharacterized protein MONOS_4957 [Monocercomonoides exilis]|uniref:uncharacterized protein n=1 Tax=Monocercomonoides exilis TaxID=2049356 RepID=UPI00355A20C1|nr:hypothetical protein MONOS_4957 [Monocercomonoides exilis]|eukprot:MONOS_4957.1-p1 / transcript=MONOS_4957.1 / gene=MONOS_4957 / organism=Monocercomonoides_exilis_PA203 / gene_product=unspecified product / transcript_product=unspecified product / location=Mono_scaffold00139:20193-20699(+) / protein_length=169 / sequence_SO=supercontig / SO=protein_coding / is_pseudo=false
MHKIFSSQQKPFLWNNQGASAFPVNNSVMSEYELFFHPYFRLFTTLDSSCHKVSTSQLRSAADAISFSLFAHFRANQSISLHYSLSCLPELFNKRGESREPSSSCKGIGLTALSSVVKHCFVGIDCLDGSLRIVKKCQIRCTSDTAGRIDNLVTRDKNSCLSEKICVE